MLDKTKHYGFYSVGSGIISEIIQKVSFKTIQENKTLYKQRKPSDIATHCGCLFFVDPETPLNICYPNNYSYKNYSGWLVVESHFKTQGVKIKSLYDFLRQAECPDFCIFEDHLDITEICRLVGNKTKYGTLDIINHYINFGLDSLLGTSWNEGNGQTCSEFYANVQKDKKILNHFGLLAHQIKPLEIQEWVDENSLKIIEGKDWINYL